MSIRRFLGLGLALSVVLFAAGCGNSGDDAPPGDDEPPGDDTPNNPDAPPGSTPDAPPGGTPDAPPGACANIAGAWAIIGDCGADLCTFTQAGCAITQVSCTSGAHSTSGSLTGNNFTYTGESGTGVPATCNGTITGDDMAGTCTVVGVPCGFTGNRQ